VILIWNQHEGAVSPLTIEPIPHSSEVDPDKMHEAHSKVAAAYEDVRSREIALMGKGFKLAEGIRTTQKEVRYLKKHGTPLNAGFLSWTATALKSVFGKKTDPVDLIHSLETKLRVQEIELRNLVSELDDVSRERQAEQQTVCNHLAYMEEMGVQLLYEEWYRKEAMPKYQRDYGYGKENGVFQLVPINWDILLEECELTEEEMEQEMFFDR